jgi:hypothetical protein
VRVAPLALAVVLAAGCGGSHSPVTPTPTPTTTERAAGARPASDSDALQALLDRRAAALQRGDAAAYAATSARAQRARDRRAASRAKGLELRGVALTGERFGVAGAQARLRVRFRYGISGVQGRFEAVRQLAARKTRRGWRVVRDPGDRQRQPWELARFRAARSGHFVVLAAGPTNGLPEAFEAGYRKLRDDLRGATLRRRYLVVVARDGAMAKALTNQIRGVETLAAISDSAVREFGPAKKVTDVVSQRVLVVWTHFGALDQAGRERVATHELTHAALAGRTSGRTPAWLLEGIALWASGDRRSADAARLVDGARPVAGATAAEMDAARRTLALARLAEPDAIARMTHLRQAAAYAYSSAAAFYVADHYGSRKLLALYDAFNDEQLAGPAGAQLSDEATRRVLHVSLATLDRQIRQTLT